MATRKSVDEKLVELYAKKAQLAEQEKRLKAQQKEQLRKAQTKQLIQLGTIIEKVLGRPTTEEDLPKLLNYLEQQEQRGSFFSKAMNKPTPTQPSYNTDTTNSSNNDDGMPF